MEIVPDEKVFSKADTEALGIMTGDIVCFCPRTTITKSGFIKSRFLDDKLSAAILMGYAKYLKDNRRLDMEALLLFLRVSQRFYRLIWVAWETA